MYPVSAVRRWWKEVFEDTEGKLQRDNVVLALQKRVDDFDWYPMNCGALLKGESTFEIISLYSTDTQQCRRHSRTRCFKSSLIYDREAVSSRSVPTILCCRIAREVPLVQVRKVVHHSMQRHQLKVLTPVHPLLIRYNEESFDIVFQLCGLLRGQRRPCTASEGGSMPLNDENSQKP